MRRLLAVSLLLAIGPTAPAGHPARAQGAGVFWLIFVDDLHLDFINTSHIRKLLASIATDLIRDGDAFAVRTTGPALQIESTTNRALFELIIPKFSGMGMKMGELQPLPRFDPMEEVGYRASVAGTAATEMLKTVSLLARRRTVMLYVSNGYYVDRPEASIAAFPRAAQQAGVTVFAMNPRGLPDAAAIDTGPDVALFARYQAGMLESLRAIAEPTGGFAALSAADFTDALERIARVVR